jgi:signal transduction histidine kinase
VNTVVAMLVTRLLLVQIAVGSFALVFVALFASRLLLLDQDVVWAALPVTAGAGATLFVLACVHTLYVTRPLRATLRSLTIGGTAVPAADVLRLYALPAKLTMMDTVAAMVVGVATLFRPIRPPSSDLATQASLVLLGVTFASAAVLPLYVMLRAQIAMVFEVAPLASLREALFVLADRAPDRSYVRNRFVFAVTVPVAFVALGASLLVQSHASAYETATRKEEAQKLALGAFDLVGRSPAGRAGALAAANAHGVRAEIDDRPAALAVVRDEAGMAVVNVPLEDGHATLAFATEPLRPILGVYALVALVAAALAGILGFRLGERFVADVGIATRAVRETGAADVLRGSRVRREARFDSVILLMDAIDSLGGVFREFASAQERAIDARAATERMRGLFLASMSHDLKGPLNAILGFAELVGRSPLSPAQQESLTIIEQRGRELLTLIHTVLDSARVEAGELRVAPEWTMVGDVVMSAVLDARDLAVGSDVEIVAEIQPGVPRLYADSSRLVQALTAVIQSAVRFTQKGTIHVRATVPAGTEELRVDVESSGRTAPGTDREKLFDAFKDTDRARRHGSLGLGLSLARSIVELHGGTVEGSVTKLGGTVFTLRIPTEPERVLAALADPDETLSLGSPPA